MENLAEVLLQIARIPEATAQEEAPPSQIARFIQGLGHLTAETGFKSEIGMSMTETGETQGRGNGTGKLIKSGHEPETEIDCGNEKESETKGEIWTEKERD